jgi:hypothetical protein
MVWVMNLMRWLPIEPPRPPNVVSCIRETANRRGQCDAGRAGIGRRQGCAPISSIGGRLGGVGQQAEEFDESGIGGCLTDLPPTVV